MNLQYYYGETFDKEFIRARLEKLLTAFSTNEKTDADYLFSSPGRAEILGNHTDHNHGLVLVAAISCDILAAVKKTDNNKKRIAAPSPTLSPSSSNPFLLIAVDFPVVDVLLSGTIQFVVLGVFYWVSCFQGSSML
jgi:hypothetical protein